jgi:hypothetical protein
MSLIIFSLTCLFLTKFFIQPTICAQPVNIQDFEVIDITLVLEQFPSIVDKIKETGMLFRSTDFSLQSKNDSVTRKITFTDEM